MNPQQFNTLSERDKKEFLSNDVIERVVRVEQKISSKFGKLIPYFQTEVYKCLSEENKHRYEKYLKNKKRNKVLKSILLISPIFLVFLLNISITGNVVNTSITQYTLLDYTLLASIVIIAILIILHMRKKRARKDKLNNYTKLMDLVYLKRK